MNVMSQVVVYVDIPLENQTNLMCFNASISKHINITHFN